MSKKLLIWSIAVLFLSVGVTSAANLLSNPGFEDPVVANNTSTYVVPTGWNYVFRVAATSFYLYRPVPVGTFPPTEGAQRFVVGGRSLITQQVEAIEANTIYTFQLDVLPYTNNNGAGGQNDSGRISLRIYNGNSYVVLAESADFRNLNYRLWNRPSIQWDSTDYPQFWGKPLTAAIYVCELVTVFADNSSLEKAASPRRISITRDIPESFIAVSENGATYNFNVELLQAPTSDVSFVVDPNYSQVDLGAGAGAPVTLTFTSSNWNTPQAVTVSAVNDAVAENVTFDSLNFSISSSDPAYSSSDPNVAVCLNPLPVKVVDDDSVGQLLYNGGFELPALTTEGIEKRHVMDGWVDLYWSHGYQYNPPSSSAIQPTEGNTRIALLYGTTILQPVGSVIKEHTGYVFAVDIYAPVVATQDSGLKLACYDSADLLNPANLTILAEKRYDVAAPSAWKRFYVDWNSDSAPQYVGKKLGVILTVATPSNNILDNSTLNENYILLQETDSTTVVSERASLGNTDTYSIVLIRQPASDVTITATPPADANSINLGAGVGVPVVLTFTSSNWQTPQTITVTGIDDSGNEGKTPKIYTITHSAASGDPYFGGAYVRDVKVTVNDDDYPAVLFNDAAALEVSESGQTDQYGAYLQIAPTADVTITLTPSADITVDPSVLTFTTANWNTPQTVTVTAVNDSETEVSPEIAGIVHTVSSLDAGYAAVTPITLNISVIDNDYCGNWGFYPADLNQDCYVNLADFYILASEWMECTHPADVSCLMP